MMTTFLRIWRAGFKNIFRNAWLSTAATSIMVVTILIMTFFAFSSIFVRSQLTQVRSKIDLSIFLSDDATKDQIQALQSKIGGIENVTAVNYVSKTDALERLKNSSTEGEKLAKSAQEIGNPLPASFEVKLVNIDQISSSNGSIKSLEEATIITDTSLDNRDDNRQGVVENVISISNSVSRIGAILSILFLIIALMIIFNTIRMAIFTRREEVEIMKLVGATKWFIRGPFLVEGTLYGIFGAILSLAILIPFTRAVSPFLTDKLGAGSTLDYFASHFLAVSGSMFAIGILIGIISSWLALIRYLKI
ncbi:MAG: permease-like cell division protein FtsX [Patescibacteria group bacterium]|jgi:cell division transport system permease protein|nr:permease-like cell division protein FtsX [Patescibacteria group bacterium]